MFTILVAPECYPFCTSTMPAFMYSRRRSTRRLRYRKKRPYVRRRSFRRKRQPSGLPDSIFVTLKYCDAIAITSGSTNLHQFRANSCFDPDLTAAGHQPYLFDQYSAFYSRYMVYGCRYEVIYNNNDTVAHLVTIWPSTSATVLAVAPADAKEKPYSKFMQVGNQDGANYGRITGNMSTKKMRGGAMMDDDFGALINANPQRLWFWNLNVVRGDGLSGNIDATVTHTLWIKVRFYKRQEVTTS